MFCTALVWLTLLVKGSANLLHRIGRDGRGNFRGADCCSDPFAAPTLVLSVLDCWQTRDVDSLLLCCRFAAGSHSRVPRVVILVGSIEDRDDREIWLPHGQVLECQSRTYGTTPGLVVTS
jgi:hypothetical protein